VKTSIFFNKKTAMIAVFMAYEPQVVNQILFILCQNPIGLI